MVRTFIQGRKFAPTRDEAIELIKLSLLKRNYKTVGEVAPYPCPVQHRKGTTWWEWLAEVIEIPGGGEGNDGRKATQTDCIKTT